MGKSLVIVESPGKIDKINKYLGKDVVVKASIGHIRDLPSGQSKSETKASTVKSARNAAEKEQKLFSRMGIDPEHGWNPQYEDRKSTRLNSSHQIISYAVFCLK